MASRNSSSTDTSDRSDDPKKVQPSTSWYRGYFTAEQQKPVVEHEPTLGSMVLSGMFSAIPIVFMYWMYLRSNVAAQQATKAMSSKQGQSRMQKIMADMQKMMRGGIEDRNFLVESKSTKFSDVIGIPEAKAEVQQYVDFLKTPDKFTRLGARLPKGCLLTGEPGTGKTLLAKAVAGESGVPFYTCSGADFIEVYSGSGPKRVRELFASAKKTSPSVIFIDEIDAVGMRGHGRMSGSSQSSGEENRTVNQLLAELDGLQNDDLVVVFAATNHQDNIDKALLREGRFDRKVELPMPDLKAREELFSFALNKVITGDPSGTLQAKTPAPPKDANDASAAAAQTTSTTTEVQGPVDPDPSVSNAKYAAQLATLTPGTSPATVVTIVNEGAIAAAVAGAKYVKLEHLFPAIDDVLVGRKHRSRMSDEATRRVALHEAGHTLVAWKLPTQSDVVKVSITPRGNAAGFTQQVGREKLDMQTDVDLFTDICVMLGGRIAESTRYTNLTNGAYDDLQRATRTAVMQFLALGMSAHVGLLAFDPQRVDAGRMYQMCSEATQRRAEEEAQRMVDAAFRFTTKLVEENKEQLNALTTALVAKNEVLHDDLSGILGKRSTELRDLDPRARESLKRFVRSAESAGASEAAAKMVEKQREEAVGKDTPLQARAAS